MTRFEFQIIVVRSLRFCMCCRSISMLRHIKPMSLVKWEKIKRAKRQNIKTSITQMWNNLMRGAPTTRDYGDESTHSQQATTRIDDSQGEEEHEEKGCADWTSENGIKTTPVRTSCVDLLLPLICCNFFSSSSHWIISFIIYIRVYVLITSPLLMHVTNSHEHTYEHHIGFTLRFFAFSSLFLQYLFHFAAATLYEYVHSIYKRFTNHPFIAVSHCSTKNSIYLRRESAPFFFLSCTFTAGIP